LNLADNRHKDIAYMGFRESNNYLNTPAAPGWGPIHSHLFRRAVRPTEFRSTRWRSGVHSASTCAVA